MMILVTLLLLALVGAVCGVKWLTDTIWLGMPEALRNTVVHVGWTFLTWFSAAAGIFCALGIFLLIRRHHTMVQVNVTNIGTLAQHRHPAANSDGPPP